MKILKTTLVFLVATQGFLLPQNFSVAGEDIAPPVIINEIFWSGSSLSLADEFIELANTTDQEIDISNWTIENAAAGDDNLLLPTSSTIPALGFFLVANYSSDNDKTILAAEGDLVESAISLANSEARYVLRDAEGNSVDEAGSGSGAPFAGDNGLKASMARKPGCWDGGVEVCWFTTDTQTNIKAGFSDFATPDAENNWNEPPINSAPKAVIDAPAIAEVNTIVIFDGQDSFDPEESALEYVWRLDEEEIATTEYFTVAFSEPGTAEVWLTVSDGELEDSTSTKIMILPEPEPEYTPEPGDILINEFMPDPADGAEWIEIINQSTSTIDLEGWEIWDGKGKIFKLEGNLDKSEFLLAPLNSAKLNNSGDQILLKFGETIIDAVTYGDWQDKDISDNAPFPGQLHALARLPGAADSGSDIADFKITSTPTPGGANLITAPPQEETEEAPPITTPPPTPPAAEPEKTPPDSPAPGRSYLPDEIIINEFVSDPPSGGVEWIEIYNPSDSVIDLNGWSIIDAAGGKTALAGTIEAGKYYVAYSPKGQLNNKEDEISLFDPNNNLINKIIYGYEIPSPKKGESLARTSDEWELTCEPTPGSANIIKLTDNPADDDELLGASEENGASENESGETADAKTSSGTKKTASQKSVYLVTSLDQMDNWEEKNPIQITATVTVAPGVLGKQYFYAGQDDGRGIQVYNYKKDFPEIQIGDQITVQGELSKTYDMWRIKTQNRDDIGVISAEEIEPFPIAADEVDLNNLGAFVIIEGEVTEFKSNYLYLDDGRGEIKVQYEKGGSLSNIKLTAGDKISVRGILTATKEGYRLETRLPDDIEIVKQNVAETENVEEKRPYTNWAGIIPLAILLVLGIANLKKLKKFIPAK